MKKPRYHEACLLCGKTFRSPAAEARHRHNAPLLCKKAKEPKVKKEDRP